MKRVALNDLKNYVKDNLKLIDDINGTITDNNQNGACLTKSDLAEIELSLQSNMKHIDTKGTRFTHSEKLQFTKEDSDQAVTVSSSSEEKKEEEIKSLKESLDNLNKSFEDLESEIKRLNGLISKVIVFLKRFIFYR
jgi:chromosome segregation ATPase